jgi:hypothetical protein
VPLDKQVLLVQQELLASKVFWVPLVWLVQLVSLERKEIPVQLGSLGQLVQRVIRDRGVTQDQQELQDLQEFKV